jgi:ABC-type lipoprotein export system ATPase subunit
MSDVAVRVSTPVSRSMRARQLSAMFDVPEHDEDEREWHGKIPLDEREWNVGLIVGPSGAGKTTVARQLFGDELLPEWQGLSVIDDFRDDITMDDIAASCQAVGFNTIPAWLRPHAVLSTGERFRVELARRMIEAPDDRPLLVDEFTSVVDRQVAKIGAHAVQKWVRKHDRQFVAVSCHHDIVDWLRPDWVLEPATMTFRWESLRPRPPIAYTIERVPHTAWRLFAPFHYLTATLHRSARCFVLFVEDEPAAFAGVLHRPHARVSDVKGLSRLVTLPDWQGLGLAFVLSDALGAAYKRSGYRFHTYPAHPALIHGYDRSPMYTMTQAPRGALGRGTGSTSSTPTWRFGRRPNAVFEYVGAAAERDDWLHSDPRERHLQAVA